MIGWLRGGVVVLVGAALWKLLQAAEEREAREAATTDLAGR